MAKWNEKGSDAGLRERERPVIPWALRHCNKSPQVKVYNMINNLATYLLNLIFSGASLIPESSLPTLVLKV